MKKYIPNALTLSNLICGTIAILLAMNGNPNYAAIMVFLAAVFDFFDGFSARLLNVKSELGKELDSLSDMISFGFAPAIIAYQAMQTVQLLDITVFNIHPVAAAIVLPYPCCAALRLAKFNIDNRQRDRFYGLPTPAAAFALISVQFFPSFEFAWIVYVAVILTLSVLMCSRLPLLALKFPDFSFKANKYRYLLIVIAMAMAIYLQLQSPAYIVLVYILVSIVDNIDKNMHKEKNTWK